MAYLSANSLSRLLHRALWLSVLAFITILVYSIAPHEVFYPVIAYHELGHAAVCTLTGGTVYSIAMNTSGGITSFTGGWTIPIVAGGTLAVIILCAFLFIVPYVRAYALLCVTISLLGLSPTNPASDGQYLSINGFEPLILMLGTALIIEGVCALELTLRDIESLKITTQTKRWVRQHVTQ